MSTCIKGGKRIWWCLKQDWVTAYIQLDRGLYKYWQDTRKSSTWIHEYPSWATISIHGSRFMYTDLKEESTSVTHEYHEVEWRLGAQHLHCHSLRDGQFHSLFLVYPHISGLPFLLILGSPCACPNRNKISLHCQAFLALITSEVRTTKHREGIHRRLEMVHVLLKCL